MGFEREVSQIVSILNERCPQKKQSILLSATLGSGVERLAGMSLDQPVRVDITERNQGNITGSHDNTSGVSTVSAEVFSMPKTLSHHYVIVPSKLRLVTLVAFLLWKAKYSSKDKKMVVFLSTQDSVDFHLKVLSTILNGGTDTKTASSEENTAVAIYGLHGDMTQESRTKTYQVFTKTKSGVLLCTDVAARGLNLENVRWIVQYNTPGTPTDYIHRSGRTARIGTQGHALLFLTPSEVQYLDVLRDYQISFHELQMEDILKTLLVEAEQWTRPGRQLPHTVEEAATALQNTIEVQVTQDNQLKELARKAYQSFIRAYATYPSNLKHIFHVKLLHLGHTAKSFGLQDAPTHIANKVAENIQYQKKRLEERQKLQSRKRKVDVVSEFSSGLNSDGTLKLNKKAGNKPFRKNKIKKFSHR